MTLRNTRQRRVIREVFVRAGRPLGAQEVLSAAQQEVEGLGIATVYRAIRTLLEEGTLVTVELPGEAPRYEISGKEHHHHFRCCECRKVFELSGCPADLSILAPPGFQVTGHDVVLYGRCPACSRGKRRTSSARVN